MPHDACTDMSGAIKRFQQLDVEVQRVETYEGGRLNITYERLSATRWQAVEPDGRCWPAGKFAAPRTKSARGVRVRG